jgi:dienelactone hydrolase
MSPASSRTFIERFKLGVADTAKAFLIDMWLARHTPEKVVPILHKVINGAKEEYADAIASGGGIYAVGYCFGAKYALLLGSSQQPASQPDNAADDEEHDAALPAEPPLIKAAAIAHGTQIVPADFSNLKVPTCLICVEDDPLFSNEIRQAGIEALEKGGVEHEVKVYPEVPHGFAVYGDYEDASIKEAQRTAYGQILGWIQAH